MLFFSKRSTFGYCDVSTIFSVNCKLHRNLCFAETNQKQVVFLRKKLDKIKSQVKMQAMSFKQGSNATIESNICFAIIKQPSRYFINNMCG